MFMPYLHPVRVLLCFIIFFSLFSFVKASPFNATDLIPRVDSPESSESHQPDFLSHHDEHRNPSPEPIGDERYKALIENGKLMYAYLQGTFDLPASQIQGPGDDDNVRDWHDNYKKALQSQGWVPSDPSETKADMLHRVCRLALRGTKAKAGDKWLPVLTWWTSLSWEKESSSARFSHMIEFSDSGYDRDLLRKNMVVYEMKGLPASTYPATDLGYFDWEYFLRYKTPVYPQEYRTCPTAIIFANIYNKDAEDLAIRFAPFGTGNWPGIHYPIETSRKRPVPNDNFYALLGTTFGQYVTYFLRTHQSVFGKKRVHRIHMTNAEKLPIAWDTKVDGEYPHVFVFRIGDSPRGYIHQHDSTVAESSAQAAARPGGSSKHDEEPHDDIQRDTESNGDESPEHGVSRFGSSPHFQDQPQNIPRGSQNTVGVDQPMGGTTAQDSEGSSGQPSHPGHSPGRMETSEQSSNDEEE